MRRYGRFALLTAASLLVLTTWLGPKTLAWWFAPPAPVPISCNEAVNWATTRLVHAQLYSIALGLLGGLVLAFVTRSKTTAQASLPPATAAGKPSSQPGRAGSDRA